MNKRLKLIQTSIVIEDKEIQGLQIVLKALEKDLQQKLQEKNDYLNTINEFNIQYTLHVGELIQKILHVKQEIYHFTTAEKRARFQHSRKEYEALKQAIDMKKAYQSSLEKALTKLNPLDDAYNELYEKIEALKEELNVAEEALNQKYQKVEKDFDEDPDIQEYEETKRMYEEFRDDFQEKLNAKLFDLGESEKKELKQLYRQASRLCHPDIVADELKTQAHEMMQKLNDAYSKKDLVTVKEILFALQHDTGFSFASNSINNKEKLKAKIVKLRKKIKVTENEITEIKLDEIFEIIKDLDNWDTYFEELKGNLKYELMSLMNNYNALRSYSLDEGILLVDK